MWSFAAVIFGFDFTLCSIACAFLVHFQKFIFREKIRIRIEVNNVNPSAQ